MIYQICITEDGKYGAFDVDNDVLACTADDLEELKKKINMILNKALQRGDNNEPYRRNFQSNR